MKKNILNYVLNGSIIILFVLVSYFGFSLINNSVKSSKEIKEITMALANYFRIVLSSGKDIISVHDEVEHVISYLVIQKMRYESLNYKIEVNEEACGRQMPKLLLQPLVENAIYHGIEPAPDGGTLRISIARHDDELRLCIENPVNAR